MKALLVVTDDAVRASAERTLRRVGCTEFSYNLDDITDSVGIIHYAVIEVFDPEVTDKDYSITPACPLIQRVKRFVDEHPECYVIAVTHKACANDGRIAMNIANVDWWITADDVRNYLVVTLRTTYTNHHAFKGIPSWTKDLWWCNWKTFGLYRLVRNRVHLEEAARMGLLKNAS
jgi:hypothetical protein